MLPPHRLFLWSLVVGLLLSSNHAVAQEEAVEESSESPAERRQLWDAWGFMSLLSFGKYNALLSVLTHNCLYLIFVLIMTFLHSRRMSTRSIR
jgi:hypothetical protein